MFKEETEEKLEETQGDLAGIEIILIEEVSLLDLEAEEEAEAEDLKVDMGEGDINEKYTIKSIFLEVDN